MSKCYSADEEMFYPDFQEVISQIEERDEPLLGATYFEADSVKHLSSRYINFDRLIEDMECAAYDEAPDYLDESELFVWTAPAKELEDLISKWLDENVIPQFSTVQNVVEKIITEDDL